MDPDALGEGLEEAVERLIPPAAREAVLGDLRESCHGRWAYLCEIVKTAPFVIASQMARHLNLPVLMLQGALAFWFFNPLVAALVVLALMLREAYQPMTRPDPRRALRNAMHLSFTGLFLGLLTPVPVRQALMLALLAGPFSLFLCGLRTGLILSMDRCEAQLPDSMALTELRACREIFWKRVTQRRRLEMAALVLAALCWPAMIGSSPGVTLGAIFLAAALYLFHLDFTAERDRPGDFVTLRRRYVEEMRSDEQLRRFLCWLWVVPGLVAAHAGFVTVPLAPQEQTVARAFLAVLLCFGAGAINREERGRVREEISLLDALSEKPSVLA